ncbi:pentatricopeptide repeat-containing protein DOT4, chloroplastic [Amaranthus tricolor]|uniref:pentatricopeptide repeat-containing protein DOT4, chloroplastic n=1 Tax=Amaranthus tricolor TaxID=29722 RepID=UPI00258AE5A7|nr:pentatricopeptide repeat-containing protein DOT4, chloroplastic [Amaranthus tricolor]
MAIRVGTSINSNTFSVRPSLPNMINHYNSFKFLKPTSNIDPISNFMSAKTAVRMSTVLNKPISGETIDYNQQIRHLCEGNRLSGAVGLLCSSPKSELELGTYCLVLQLCAKYKSLQEGRRVHSAILSNSLHVCSVLGAKLVFMYVNCGDLVEGRKIFDIIANEKVYLWNLLIKEYTKVGNFKEGIYLYNKMRDFGVEPDAYTFSSVLKCFSGFELMQEGEKAHGCLLKLNLGANTVVVNSLISFYFMFGKLEKAQKLFDELLDRDVVSWNSMISGYASNGFARKAIDIFKQMICCGIFPNSTTLICVLSAIADVAAVELGAMVHGYMVKTGFHQDLTCNNTLLDMYSKCGDLNGAIEVFENMGERNIVSWTSMIGTYTREGLSDAAVKLFHEKRNKGIKPDTFAMTAVLNACASSGLLEDGKEAHEYVKKHNMDSDMSVCNALMDMYIKCGSMKDAELIFSQLVVVDTISWNIMLGGYSKNGLPNEALNLFHEMLHELKPDAVSMSCILPACTSLSALETGKQIHAYILRNGHYFDQYVANALVDMYVKCGQLASARLVFDMIPSKDLVTWTIMIAGYCIHGLGNEANIAFADMRNEGIQPDEKSFTSILYGCVHSGLLSEGRRFYLMMEKEFNIELKLEHYLCMVNLLANAGRLEEAYKFIERVPLEPDESLWGALLQGCRVHHDVKLAEKVVKRAFELEPNNTTYSTLLANIYEEDKTWEKFKWLRNKIKHLGPKKNLICSWIEANEKVQIFIAGNVSAHPDFKKIDTFLKKLRTRRKNEKYSLKGKRTFIDEEETKKEVALCGHSEISAVAFGVLNMAPGKTISVTKNSKICYECHETAKFISKVCRREIVLRDSHRFHHFKDARCSCKG